MLKAFIFDMDGVIIDSEPLHFEVDLESALHFGIPMTLEKLEEYVGMTNPEMWKLIYQQFDVKHSVEEMLEYHMKRKISRLQQLQVKPIQGIPNLIHQLKQAEVRLAVASSSPMNFIEAVLQKFNLRSEFDYIISGEEVPHGKPSPDIFLEASRQLHAKPQQCVVLEDSRNGVIAATKASMYCIGFNNPNSGRQDLSLADETIDSIDQIQVERLQQLFSG